MLSEAGCALVPSCDWWVAKTNQGNSFHEPLIEVCMVTWRQPVQWDVWESWREHFREGPSSLIKVRSHCPAWIRAVVGWHGSLIWGCNSHRADPPRVGHMGKHKALQTLWSCWANPEKPCLRISSWREVKSLSVVQATSLLGVVSLGAESRQLQWGSPRGRPWGLRLPEASHSCSSCMWSWDFLLGQTWLNVSGNASLIKTSSVAMPKGWFFLVGI